MIVLQIMEVQMRIEIDDDAATLRVQQTVIKCVQMSQEEPANGRQPKECRDCGERNVCCRCCPGEG